MAAPLFFVVRTDLTADSGAQRVFGAFDLQADAAEFAGRLSGQMLGDFAVMGPAPVALRITREVAPVEYVAGAE